MGVGRSKVGLDFVRLGYTRIEPFSANSGEGTATNAVKCRDARN